jgi:hypothetical protein
MVEVSPKKDQLRIPVWKYLLFLLLLLIVLIAALLFTFSSGFSARNSFLESLRRYLSFASSMNPGLKPQDDFGEALRIHGIEKVGEKRFYLYVSVTDKNSSPLKTLNPANIKLSVFSPDSSEEACIIDKVKPLHFYGNLPDPISFAAVMDYSGSMFPHDVKAIENNFSEFTNEIALPFSASVIKFNEKVKQINQLTSDKGQILDAIKKRISLTNTALYDGLDKGIETVQARPHLRFIVLTTDGNDNASKVSLSEVIRRAQQHNISIFAFGFGWLKVDRLKEISQKTEGYYSYVPDSSNLDEWFQKLGQIINNIQVIEFSTSKNMNMPGKITLELTDSGLTRTINR